MAPAHRHVLVALAAVSSLALAACSGATPDRDDAGVITESVGGADIFAIEVGDCTGELATGDLSELDAVPCSDPHTSEAYAAQDLDDGDFPGDTEVQSQADEFCSTSFETFVGLPYDDSELFLTSLTPTEESWAQGDQEILCLVYDEAAQTTGTLKDANR